MAVQMRVRFEGQVQGVGFRWTARRLAGNYTVDGWVRNCADGAVELVAEGEPGEVDAYLGDLRAAMSGHIRNESTQEAPPEGLSGFVIRH